MSILTNTKRWIELEAELNKRNRISVFASMVYNYIIYGVFPQEYYHYGFYKKRARDKRTYFTTKLYYKRRKQLSNPQYENVIFLDKYIFAQVFGDLYKRRCMLIDENTDRMEVINFLREVRKVVYKPLESCEGRGIKTYSVEEYGSPEKACDAIFSEKTGRSILDEWLVQSDEMNKFYSKGVNCIRVHTFLYKGHFEFLDAKVSFGIDSDIVNATLDGNLFATVDVQTGMITSDLTDYTLVCYKEHPVTHFTAKNTQLPCWEDVLDLAKKAAYRVPQVAYVGWDIALTDKGPVLIEGNHCGGCGGNQFCTLREEKTGVKEKWDVIARI